MPFNVVIAMDLLGVELLVEEEFPNQHRHFILQKKGNLLLASSGERWFRNG